MQCLGIVIGSSSSRGYDVFNGNLLTVVMSVTLLILVAMEASVVRWWQ